MPPEISSTVFDDYFNSRRFRLSLSNVPATFPQHLDDLRCDGHSEGYSDEDE